MSTTNISKEQIKFLSQIPSEKNEIEKEIMTRIQSDNSYVDVAIKKSD